MRGCAKAERRVPYPDHKGMTLRGKGFVLQRLAHAAFLIGEDDQGHLNYLLI